MVLNIFVDLLDIAADRLHVRKHPKYVALNSNSSFISEVATELFELLSKLRKRVLLCVAGYILDMFR